MSANQHPSQSSSESEESEVETPTVVPSNKSTDSLSATSAPINRDTASPGLKPAQPANIPPSITADKKSISKPLPTLNEIALPYAGLRQVTNTAKTTAEAEDTPIVHMRKMMSDLLMHKNLSTNASSDQEGENSTPRSIFGGFFGGGSSSAKKDEKKAIKGGKKLKISKDLSNLIVYMKAKSFKSLDVRRAECKFWDVSSISETKSLEIIKSRSADMIRLTLKQFMRIYPSGKRFGSGNYDPIPHWSVGHQLVALNYQTYGTPPCLNAY